MLFYNNKNPIRLLSDIVHILMQGVPYCQTVMCFYSTHVNVFSFMPANRVHLPLASFHETRQCWAAIRGDLKWNALKPAINVESTDRNPFASLSKVWLLLCRSAWHSWSLKELLWKLVLMLSKSDEKCRNYRENLIYAPE